MKQTHEASILRWEKKAKLAALVESRFGSQDDSNSFKTTRILTLDGRKLRSLKGFIVHSREREGGVKICSHRVLCYENFFVIEEVKRKLFSKEGKDLTKYETQLLDYQGNEICRFGAAWNEAEYFAQSEDKQ